MREVILGSSEEDFIRSLSHSSPWQARGGKSGAAFYATEGETFSHLLIQWYPSFPQVIHEWLELRQEDNVSWQTEFSVFRFILYAVS